MDYLLHLHGVVSDRLELIRLSLLNLKHTDTEEAKNMGF